MLVKPDLNSFSPACELHRASQQGCKDSLSQRNGCYSSFDIHVGF